MRGLTGRSGPVVGCLICCALVAFGCGGRTELAEGSDPPPLAIRQLSPCEMAGRCEDRGQSGMLLWFALEYGLGPLVDQAGCDDSGNAHMVMRCQEGVSGHAVRFEGDGLIQVPSFSEFRDLRQLTVEAWVLWEGAGRSSPVVVYGDGKGGDAFGVWLTEGRLQLALGAAPGKDYPADCTGMTRFEDPGAALVPVGVWTHLAVTVSHAEARAEFFVDGRLDGNVLLTNGAICRTQEPLTMGTLDPASSNLFVGLIDELKVWSRIRSAEEICSDAGGSFVGRRCSLRGVTQR